MLKSSYLAIDSSNDSIHLVPLAGGLNLSILLEANLNLASHFKSHLKLTLAKPRIKQVNELHSLNKVC